MKAAKENEAVTAEQWARESIRIARVTRELLQLDQNRTNAVVENGLGMFGGVDRLFFKVLSHACIFARHVTYGSGVLTGIILGL